MPSYATHVLFAEEAFEKAFGRPVSPEEGPWLALGAQGPDPFFSGIGRKPSGSVWAHRLHREGFGRFAASLARITGRARSDNRPDADALSAYAAGFATHAVLDRAVHPFVNFFSGWPRSGVPESETYRFCHPYMERCIDLIMLRDRRGISLVDFGFPPAIPGAEESARVLAPVLASCLIESYADAPERGEAEAVSRNALLDDADFHTLLNPANPAASGEMTAMERRGELPPRSLALLYPREDEMPRIDFMNESGRPWKDPRTGEEKGTGSFGDLFDTAVDAGAEAITRAAEGKGVEEFLGNGNLDDGRTDGERYPLVFSDPLPISPEIDRLYEEPAPTV